MIYKDILRFLKSICTDNIMGSSNTPRDHDRENTRTENQGHKRMLSAFDGLLKNVFYNIDDMDDMDLRSVCSDDGKV